MLGTIQDISRRCDYRRERKRNRTSLAATIGEFLLEHRGQVYSGKELVDIAHDLGFQKINEKKILNACLTFNSKAFRVNRIHLSHKDRINIDWLIGESSNIRLYYAK